VRGLGLLYGLEFVRDPDTREPWPELARRIYTAGLDLGVRTAFGGNILRLAPPFTIGEDELLDGIDRLERAVATACREMGAGR
jgi:4-aminobutyrate aminotransferase/(S)-3-amino-2-methylpropionate transaminase